MTTNNQGKLIASGTDCYLVGHPASAINGAKLLTTRQVLFLCFRSIDTSGNRKDDLKETVKDVMSLRTMARIETMCERSCSISWRSCGKNGAEFKKQG